ncbi:hypothetical protein TraAM80_04810 [Trypanosoma rangeli]|uniref:Uncharacterized protein n=1 Tax=Trypanosoma rangeli TaxID=5698 RepID=A0A3S5IR77_TRYRA|nr:uncharacterized protein TraAM80_04810 [Trypanosoma rangeli]RNF04957.1 hypothetical protein TraAM80_04810 [Trypanosoma rangeli]|eukprot:RNF04957.1 hypothetical protein TraAM80_04810 [Trypanosoma rangeli]
MIISERIPMTNGEVFALLRRRRDERNAKIQPPFGMQFVGGSNMPQQQQQRMPASTATNATAHTTIFFPPDPLVADAAFSGLHGSRPATSRVKANTSALFFSPASSHLMVLLTEVRALRYLSRYATISGSNGVHALYGPTSVHTRRGRYFPVSGSNEQTRGSQQRNALNGYDAPLLHAEEGLSETAAANEAQEHVLTQQVWSHRPGTVGHVRAVESLLGFWETKGREMERQSSTAVKAVLRAVRRRLSDSMRGNEDNPIAHNNTNYNNNTDKEHELQHPSLEQPRLLFAPPSLPLALFLAEQSPVSTGALTSAEHCQWTEQDVIKLVMARPQDSLDVHRLMDDVEELVGQNEELLNFLEEELVKVFL